LAKTLEAKLWWRRGLGQADERGYWRIDLPDGRSFYGSRPAHLERTVAERVGLVRPVGVGGVQGQ
jgi:hypothetical protein